VTPMEVVLVFLGPPFVGLVIFSVAASLIAKTREAKLDAQTVRGWFIQIDDERNTKTITTFGCFFIVLVVFWISILPFVWMMILGGL
jgi:hypothetical protein